MPVIGSNPIFIPIFCICWYKIIARKPIIINLYVLSFEFFAIIIKLKLKINIVIINIIHPINPKLLAKTEKIKSVCPSGI